MINNAVWIAKIDRDPRTVAAALELGLGQVGRLPALGESWVVKLNLTYPHYLPGVVNSPCFVEGLCQWAADRRVRLLFVEGDGGNAAYSALEAFDGTGVRAIAGRYAMECRSLSETPWEWRDTSVNGRNVRLPYPPFLLQRGFDRFITAPLFKNHIFTVASLGMKNLWGCIPDRYRMYYHHRLDEGIVALSKELRPDFSIFDGLVALRGRGPMDGDPVELNAVMVSQTVGAGEAAALTVMGLTMKTVRHLRLAHEEGMVPSPEGVRWLADPTPFVRSDFILRRSWLNWSSFWVARRPWLQRLIYHSSLSPAIYAVVNRLRRDSAQADLIKAKLSREVVGPEPRDH